MEKMVIEFKKYPKTPRFNNLKYLVTEKLDGTNACIMIQEGTVEAASRNRKITAEDDNYGFAAWVEENHQELLELGNGYHYGEWVGKGINRGYELDERRFYIFGNYKKEKLPTCVYNVPNLGSCDISGVEFMKQRLIEYGSFINKDFKNVEGLILQDKFSGFRYKVIINK